MKESQLISGHDGPVFIFAHGAGAGMMHPFMETMTRHLVRHGIRVVRFNFPYMIRQQQEEKKFPPDRAPKLLEAFEQMIEAHGQQGVVIGGKSMGGRMASLLADHPSVKGVACLGFPFHPPGKPEKMKGEHLADCPVPCLILQGERDTFGKREEVEQMNFSQQVRLEFIPDGDHSFKPRKRSGYTEEENLANAAELLGRFIREVMDEN
ncbi:alpha/beta fold hydrolase [Vibrio quintilis]|uniref:Alpha/beta hydrolase family protein n=1 Tax=Vibrio quintilis TaxID=1117707 RepID=A0A1M7YQ21_9VIBR|nr:alpha/beta fold hydrolase [Vibrio quintilis]SHO54717.1 Alpha/beta hydrolase family protein [Vibrio quintilis]